MNILDEIAQKTRERVAQAKKARPLEEIRKGFPAIRGFPSREPLQEEGCL